MARSMSCAPIGPMRPGRRLAALVLLLILFPATSVFAQGQDSTPGERYLRVMAELLPGTYDNANQNYFDRRRALPDAERHERLYLSVNRVEAPGFGELVFDWRQTRGTGENARVHQRLVSLSAGTNAGAADDIVVMRQWFNEGELLEGPELQNALPAALRRTEGCDYYFKRRAEGFRGAQIDGACRFDWEGRAVLTRNTIELSAKDLFVNDHKFDQATGERISGVASGEPYWLERARWFHCYVDVPGVGGGRDEPFERYDDIKLHDKGGSHWFSTRGDQPQKLNVALQSVTWHVLNENSGNFNRNSLVVYVTEALPDGKMQDHGYAFTEPDAERIGVNLKWMLVNCSLVPPSQARPSL